MYMGTLECMYSFPDITLDKGERDKKDFFRTQFRTWLHLNLKGLGYHLQLHGFKTMTKRSGSDLGKQQGIEIDLFILKASSFL